MARDSNRRGEKRVKGSRQNTSSRGFASMDLAQRREIASQGGIASHQKGTGHEWNSDDPREAGRKGGRARGKIL